MTRALEVAREALRFADGDTEVVAHDESSGLARFAASEVHQPTLIDNVVVTVRVVDGDRLGVASTNRVDDGGLAEVAARAREAAVNAPSDPDFPGLASPQELPSVDGYDEATARLGPEGQAALATAAIAAADVPIYGFFTSAECELAVASTTGLEASQRMTDAGVLVVAADGGRSGYADAASWRLADIDVEKVASEASAKAARTRDAKALEPGVYAAVLEPYAFADLLQYFAYDGFGALGLLEERGYLTGRIGEQIFDERISVADDSLDPRGFPKAFDFEGVPKQRVELVSDGVARGVVWDRITAKRAGNGARTTGHAPPANMAGFGPIPFALTVSGGEAEGVDDLLAAIGEGLYITRLHYLGIVDSREGVITGMTRDGTFRVREGRIAEPVVNLRFTIAFPELVANVPALTRTTTLVSASNFYGERYAYGAVVPAVATTHFNVTGIGSSPGI